MNKIKREELAEMLAVYAHQGQKDKGGRDYISHPRAVAAQVDTEEEKIIAFLHDVLEDTFVTADTIRNLFGDRVCDVIELLTHRKDESYEQYIRRLGKDPLARKIKIADLNHNMDLSRLSVITDMDRKRQKKYKKSKLYLQSLEKIQEVEETDIEETDVEEISEFCRTAAKDAKPERQKKIV